MIKFNFAAAQGHIGFRASAVYPKCFHYAGHKHFVVVQQRKRAPLANAAHGCVPHGFGRFFVEAQRKLRQNLFYRAARLARHQAVAVCVFRVAPAVAAHNNTAVRFVVQRVNKIKIRLRHFQRLRLGDNAVVNVVAVKVA